MTAVVESIFTAQAKGDPVVARTEVDVWESCGLAQDRHYRLDGHKARQITIISGEHLDAMEADGFSVSEGQHRRNIVVRGVDLSKLTGEFYLGDVLLEFSTPCPPCGHVEQLTQEGMKDALGANAGICARILKSGTIRVGDAVMVEPGA